MLSGLTSIPTYQVSEDALASYAIALVGLSLIPCPCSRTAVCLTWIDGCCRNLGAGAAALLTDTDRLTTLIAGLSVLALGVYSAREGTRVAGRAFDRSARPFSSLSAMREKCSM